MSKLSSCISIAALLWLSALAGLAQAAPPANADPRALVQSFYTDHFAHDMSFSTKNLRRKLPWLTAELGKMLSANAAKPSSPDLVPDIDGDVFTDTQEYPSRFRVGAAVTDGERARVPVNMTGKGVARNIQVILRKENGQWRIDDLDYGDRRSLRAILVEANR